MYAIFFDRDNMTFRLPTNPEEIEINSIQAVEKFEVLKLGQIAIPTHMELKEYSFEAEFPYDLRSYAETSGDFKNADYYISLFMKWRNELIPVRFIASSGIGEDINSLVLIEEVRIVERAGEEGDKYITFKLLEYRVFSKKTVVMPSAGTGAAATVSKEPVAVKANPKSNGSYTVASGDSLWDIAKKHYGDGAQYTKIMTANKDIIKNPSLIYSGQKLVIPA